jgi:hypothetical protein
MIRWRDSVLLLGLMRGVERGLMLNSSFIWGLAVGGDGVIYPKIEEHGHECE